MRTSFAALCGILICSLLGCGCGPRFTADSPLGIHVEDVEKLNAMTAQPWLETGFLDVTQPPYNADPTGRADSTRAIADAVFMGRHTKLAVYFPAGDYRVSDTITCMAGWHDERIPDHKYLPWVETWPCVLVGDRTGTRRPRILLAPKSPGFDKPGQPKPVLDFTARGIVREKPDSPLKGPEGATNYMQLLCSIDVVVGEGNPGAAVATFDAAEGSSIQDCTFDVGDGFTGLDGGPGSGGAIFNLEIIGGRVGMHLYSGRPTCTLAGCRFEGQSEAGLRYAQRGPLTAVGCEFRMKPGVPAVVVDDRANGSASLVDCRIEYGGGAGAAAAIDCPAAFYGREVWVRGAGAVFRSPEGEVTPEDPEVWTRVREMAATHAGYTPPMTSPIYIDGEKRSGIYKDLAAGGEPPADLRTRHLWDEASFPYWDRKGTYADARRDCGARGDGRTDDTAALQKAVDENETVFLPKGAYRITRTLRLRPNTKLFGISPAYSMIVPVPVGGGDFGDPDHPQPAIQTADSAEPGTILAFFSVFTPRQEGKGVYWLDIASAGTLVRNVQPIIGYVIADLDPLAKGIFPWTNWTWPDLASFSTQTGFMKHFWTPYNWDGEGDKPLGPDSHEGGMPNWPMVRIHGHGGAKWYIFVDLDLQQHGLRHRRMLIEDTEGPVDIYHAQLQYANGLAEMEVNRAGHVSVYGTKNERPAIALLARDSHDILFTGVGGPSTLSSSRGKVALENCRNVTLSGMTPDFHPDRPSMRYPMVVVKNGGRTWRTGPYERPALVKAAPVETSTVLETAGDWNSRAAAANDTVAMAAPEITNGSDLMERGALLLAKQDAGKPFWKTTAFRGKGSWQSKWIRAEDGKSPGQLEGTLLAYGRPQDFRMGWKRFSGNPLVCAMDERNPSPQSLRLPPAGIDNGPNDQSLERGFGAHEGKWMLIYTIGRWASYGIGYATADSLEPLKRGENPFRLEPGSNPWIDVQHRDDAIARAQSPNDWMVAGGRWFVPVEGLSRKDKDKFVDMLWTVDGNLTVARHGEIQGINGSDPGMTWDGEKYYLFTEHGNHINLCTARDPLGVWQDEGMVVDVGQHSGDADVVFFNNRWLMVFDDGPHRKYQLGCAWTTPEEFPHGWRLVGRFFKPEQPWEQPTKKGNDFGTGDGDFAVDGDTLYMVYERPVGIAWKELDVYDGEGIRATVTIECDTDGDGRADGVHSAVLRAGRKVRQELEALPCRAYRVRFDLETADPRRSPMLKNVRLGK